MKRIVWTVCGLLAASSAMAVTPLEVDSIIQLNSVVVSANKIEVNRNSVPLTISVINQQQIENSSESALLPVLSEQVPGLFVTEKGITGFGVSTGAAGTINIRGVGSGNKVLVLFDGQPQWAGLFGHSLPDTYVASDVEKVEVIRGPGSLLYGSNAMGGVINIVTIPLITLFGGGNMQRGYLLTAVLYGAIFAACHVFCFSKTREVVEVPVRQKMPLKVQIRSVVRNRPYLLALLGQILFGFILYGRNADMLYYFTYVEGDATLFSFYSLAIIVPSIIGAACFPAVFKWTSNKGWAASLFALGTGIAMTALYFFSPNTSPVPFYLFAALSQFFFSGFNTAIYAIIPDCVEYSEWITGIRNDGFQYAFISLGNKVGMALGTSLLALALGMAGYESNAVQNGEVLSIMRHGFSTIPGVLWILTAGVLFFYRLDKRTYNRIVAVIRRRSGEKGDLG